MRIAQVASLWGRIPPATYGGIELLVHLLVEEMVRRGHEVTLYASGDSITSAKLRAVCEVNILEAMAAGTAFDYSAYANAAVARAIADASEFDVIHCHVGASWIPFVANSPAQMVHTLHTALAVDERWLLENFPMASVAAISHAQIASMPAEIRNRMRVIYNACDIDAYGFSGSPGGYMVFLGRMGPQKNPAAAIRIARAAGLPLVMAGTPQSGEEEAYFEKEIKPFIDGRTVRYVGGVDAAAKRALLMDASVFLFPTSWNEPFGIAPVEAMASGVPVLALANGSVPEIIDQGVTGYHANSIEGLIERVDDALSLDRRAICEQTRRRFSHHRMVDDYLALYAELAARRR
jgi:glycosyltransferase involved in cell wall biosynthesis